MFGIGMPEMILILAVALIVIGPKKLPDLAKSLGRAMGEFKKATSDLKDSMQIDSSDIKDVKDTFEDLKDDINQTVHSSMKRADEDTEKNKSKDTGEPDEETGQDEETGALDALKEAFIKQDQETGTPDAEPDRLDPVDEVDTDTSPVDKDKS